MVIFNISNPFNPKFIGEYLNASNQDYDDIYVVNNTAYIADYQGGNLKIINVTIPYNPEILGIFDYDTVEGGPNDVFVVDNIFYLSDYDGGLKIINVSDPESITTLATYNSGGWVSGVFASDNIAYISDYQKGIIILNVTNPSIPVVLGSYYDSNDAAYSIFFDDPFVYTGYGMRGLKILDPGYDTDEDGTPDQAEIYLYQTDPDDPNSFPDLIDPIIIINSPQDDASYGASAPNYNITIIEDNLNSTWYTLDGGLTNVPFTGLTGTINQTLWDSIPNGEITLIFYAKDNAGNIGYQQVTIINSIQEIIQGYDLSMLAIILCVGLFLIIKRIHQKKSVN